MFHVCIDSLHLYMYCVFDKHILYMCRHAFIYIVKHYFSLYVLCIHVCICMSTLKCMYTESMIIHVCMYCALRCIPALLVRVYIHSISIYVCIEV